MSRTHLPEDEVLLGMNLEELLKLYPSFLPALTSFLTERAVQPQDTLRDLCERLGGSKQALLKRLKRGARDDATDRTDPPDSSGQQPETGRLVGKDLPSPRNGERQFIVCGWFGYFKDRKDGDEVAYRVLERMVELLDQLGQLREVDVLVHNCSGRRQTEPAVVVRPGPKRYENMVPERVEALVYNHLDDSSG